MAATHPMQGAFSVSDKGFVELLPPFYYPLILGGRRCQNDFCGYADGKEFNSHLGFTLYRDEKRTGWTLFSGFSEGRT